LISATKSRTTQAIVPKACLSARIEPTGIFHEGVTIGGKAIDGGRSGQKNKISEVLKGQKTKTPVWLRRGMHSKRQLTKHALVDLESKLL